MSALVDDDDFDPFEEFDRIMRADGRNPYVDYVRYRREQPVRRVASTDDDGAQMPGVEAIWKVYRWVDVTRVLREPQTFSSGFYGEFIGLVFGRTILEMDPPVHARHRALVATAFRQTVLQRWEGELITPVVDELLDTIEGQQRADLVRSLTFAFPANVIAGILGLPKDQYARFQRWVAMMELITWNPMRGYAASQQLREYFMGFVQERRENPQQDLISELVVAEVDGQRLTDEEIVSYLRLLLTAGVETTSRFSANLIHALLTHPEQHEAVKRDRGLLPQAIEEGLRWEPPILAIMRKTTRDVEVAGTVIPEGSVVDAVLGSANRDETRYPDPDAFDIFREPHQYMSFGWGPHMCLGMHLARMETKVAVSRLLDRFPNLRLDPDAEQDGIGGIAFRSPRALHVLLT